MTQRTVTFGRIAKPGTKAHTEWWNAFAGADGKATYQEFRFSQPILVPVPNDRGSGTTDHPCSHGVIITEPCGNSGDGLPAVSCCFDVEDSCYAHQVGAENLESVADCAEWATLMLRAICLSGRGPEAA